MKPPISIPAATWKRIWRAKQSLITKGPTRTCEEEARNAAITIASELRVQGLPRFVALAIVRQTPWRGRHRRAIQRQLPRWVNHAYDTGQPLLSGCPAVSTSPSKMRDSFAPYCDDACKATCAAYRANFAPEALVANSPYYPTYSSSIWLGERQGGLGLGPKQLWIILSSMAIVEQTQLVQTSMTYLSRRLLGNVHTSALYRHAKALRTHGLVELVSRKEGKYRVPVLSRGQLRRLESELGVDSAAVRNVQFAIAQTARHNARRDEAFPDLRATDEEIEVLIFAPEELARLKADRELERSYCSGAELTLDETRATWAGTLVAFPSVKPWTTEDEAEYVRRGRQFWDRQQA